MKEIFPEGHKQRLEARDLIVYKYMSIFLESGVPYKRDQIFDILKPTGVDDELKGRGFPKLTRMGSRTRGTNLISTLNNLWWNNMVRKFGKGIDHRSKRWWGVEWEFDFTE